MKGKSDLVRGWLRKAASDLVAMRASAQAGALDAACFHAQQAAEKYLKAYLADQDREILHSHNLYKLIAACQEADPAFSELIDTAELLTPFGVEARYDTEFWPSSETLKQAELAADRIAKFVTSRVPTASVRVPAVGMQRVWKEARDRFNWRVDLRKFKDAPKHPGFFDRVIEPANVAQFEDTFRAALIPGGRVERAAEVVFWKNFGNHQGRERITRDLFVWIDGPMRLVKFMEAVQQLAVAPIWESFQKLISSCGQTSGFATPLTFLSFYNPQRFPMVDRKIGQWWSQRFPNEPQFAWNPAHTVISPGKKSWEAYLAWTEFCRRLASELSETGDMAWRARDVEMAVWADVDARLPLDE
jgi:HEPN domain-containing protein